MENIYFEQTYPIKKTITYVHVSQTVLIERKDKWGAEP